MKLAGKGALPVLLGAIVLSAVLAPQALAVPAAPAWSIQSLATPTNFVPGDESGEASYQTYITNSGGEATDQSPITVTDTLPAGLDVSRIESRVPRSVTKDRYAKRRNQPRCEQGELRSDRRAQPENGTVQIRPR